MQYVYVIECSGPVGTAAAVGAEIPATRAGVRGRIGVVAAASAIGAAMPAGAATAGDFDHVAVDGEAAGATGRALAAPMRLARTKAVAINLVMKRLLVW